MQVSEQTTQHRTPARETRLNEIVRACLFLTITYDPQDVMHHPIEVGDADALYFLVLFCA